MQVYILYAVLISVISLVIAFLIGKGGWMYENEIRNQELTKVIEYIDIQRDYEIEMGNGFWVGDPESEKHYYTSETIEVYGLIEEALEERKTKWIR